MRIAVTGLGARVPGAVGPDALWERLLNPALPQPGPYAHRDWLGFWLPPDSTCAALAVEVCRQAWPDGEGPPPWLVLGTCNAMMRGTDEPWALAEAGLPVAPERVLWPQLPHQPADAVRGALGLCTPAWTVSTACTSGAVALGRAASLVASGTAPRALAVGVDVISRLTWYGFGSLGLQSSGRCLPFDRGRSGLNLGEGAAALLLERPEEARARGARIHGYITGYGNATDAYHMSTRSPPAPGPILEIRRDRPAQVRLEGLQQPHGLVRTPEGWLVADTGRGRILRLDPALQVVGVLAEGFRWLQDLAPTPDGGVWVLENKDFRGSVARTGGPRLLELDAQGRERARLELNPEWRLAALLPLDPARAGRLGPPQLRVRAKRSRAGAGGTAPG